jgi:hypothetical protein
LLEVLDFFDLLEDLLEDFLDFFDLLVDFFLAIIKTN